VCADVIPFFRPHENQISNSLRRSRGKPLSKPARTLLRLSQSDRETIPSGAQDQGSQGRWNAQTMTKRELSQLQGLNHCIEHQPRANARPERFTYGQLEPWRTGCALAPAVLGAGSYRACRSTPPSIRTASTRPRD